MSSPLFIQETRDYLLKSQLLILLDTIRCSSGQRLNDGDGEEEQGEEKDEWQEIKVPSGQMSEMGCNILERVTLFNNG